VDHVPRGPQQVERLVDPLNWQLLGAHAATPRAFAMRSAIHCSTSLRTNAMRRLPSGISLGKVPAARCLLMAVRDSEVMRQTSLRLTSRGEVSGIVPLLSM